MLQRTLKRLNNLTVRQMLFLLIALILLSSSITFFIYTHYTLLGVFSLNYEFKAAQNMGLNTDIDALRFGKIIPGNSGERKIDISNNYGFPIKLSSRIEGQYAKAIVSEPKNIVVPQSENRTIIFTIALPEDIPLGTYNGTIYFYVERG